MTKFPPEFLKQVRTACKHYDKPERIGDLPLAGVALRAALLKEPEHPIDQEGRGAALQKAIDASLKALEPQERGTRKEEVFLTLYCYIYDRDPYDHTEIAKVAPYLESTYYIAKATYHLRQKEGIEQLAFHLSAHLSEHTAWLEPAPLTQSFVGRSQELAYYRHQLETQSLAVIEGVGGIGKTSLAAQLAASTSRPVCWLTLRPGVCDQPIAVFHAWAGFMAQHGFPQLWALMRTATSEPNIPAEWLPVLKKGLAVIAPLLCLDNLETIAASVTAFWSVLELVASDSNVRLLLISQQRPPLAGLGEYALLTGLPPEQVKILLAQRGIQLPPAQVEKVTIYTHGNPRLLELWATHVRQQQDSGASPKSLEQLVRSPAVEQHLASEIITALSPGEQQAAQLLALNRRPIDGFLLQNPSDALPLDDLEISPGDFGALHTLGLIHVGPGDQWELSPMLAESLWQQSGADPAFIDKVALFHQWLARWYALQGNTLEAAYYAARGGEMARAVLLLAESRQSLIALGQSPAMSEILMNITAESLSTPVRQVWRELRQELLRLAGNHAAAKAEARVAAQETQTTIALARIERARGRAASRLGAVWQAADHYQDALRLLARQQVTIQAWLHRDLAWALLEQNDLEQAWNEAQRARIALENTMGIIAQRQGNLGRARTHLTQSVSIAQELGERRELGQAINSLANFEEMAGDFAQALANYEQNLAIVKEIGDRIGLAITLLKMGDCYAKLQDDVNAVRYKTEALALFEGLGDAQGRLLAHVSLSETHLKAGRLIIATKHAKAALQGGANLGMPTDYAQALRIYAEICLAQGDNDTALKSAQHALKFLSPPQVDEFTEPNHVASVYQTLAHVYTAQGELGKAQDCTAKAQSFTPAE